MAEKADAKTSRCWPGFEPVPGKSEHEEGSCRKKPASKNGGKEVDRERSRKKQVAAGGKRGDQAKSKSPDASERKSVAKTHTRTKKAAGKKATGATAKKTAGTRAKKSTGTAAKKTAGTRAKKSNGTAAKRTSDTRAKKSTASARKTATPAK